MGLPASRIAARGRGLALGLSFLGFDFLCLLTGFLSDSWNCPVDSALWKSVAFSLTRPIRSGSARSCSGPIIVLRSYSLTSTDRSGFPAWNAMGVMINARFVRERVTRLKSKSLSEQRDTAQDRHFVG